MHEMIDLTAKPHTGSMTVQANLLPGSMIQVPTTNAKKNQLYHFTATVHSFGKFLMGHGKTEYGSTYLILDQTKIMVNRQFADMLTAEKEHGLNIADELSVTVNKQDAMTADITVESGGGSFTWKKAAWSGDSNGDTFAESDSSVLTNCSFTWSCGDFAKPIWIFGDSYCSFGSPYRWPWYLCEAGLQDRVHINAYPGESSPFALTAFINSLSYYGCPKTLVWTLGMNDGSDTDEQPCARWLEPLLHVMHICDDLNIELILATVPTVPERYHEKKNRYVRSCGRRYIDLAEAVGADGTGVWTDGMLFTDKVHPDQKGAEAIWQRILRELDELADDR